MGPGDGMMGERSVWIWTCAGPYNLTDGNACDDESEEICGRKGHGAVIVHGVRACITQSL
jgi:hypothetical protein